LLVGNEYNELAEQRWVMIDFTFIFAGFFLKGLNWSSLAKNAPYIQLDTTNVSDNMVLRFFLDCSVMMVIGCSSYIIRRLMARFEPTSVENLIDLCYISNISMFFMDSPFHGYYVHGFNPQKQSDANLAAIMEGLKREASKPFSKRGLNPQDPTALQTFEVYVNASFRESYDALLKEIQELDKETGIAPKKGYQKKDKDAPAKSALGPKNNDSLHTEMGDKATILQNPKDKVRSLFVNLISEVQASPETYILEKNWQQYFFGVPPIENFLKMPNPYFYKDPGANFKRTSLIGIDIKLLIGNSLFFYMIDFSSGGLTVMALFFTFLLDRFIKYLRQTYGQDNISKKTFIDERFLI
jgi:meckelin